MKKTKTRIIIATTLLLTANCLLPAISFAQIDQLWGMSVNGGAYGFGVIFKINLDGTGYVHYDFDGATNGSHPYGSLMHASDGKLYGMTNTGGMYNSGVLFRFDTSSKMFTPLFVFDGGINGSHPSGSLIQVGNNKLYGMTTLGGLYGGGMLFSYDLSTSTYDTLHSFNGGHEIFPVGSLMQANDGKLYGMSSGNGCSGNGCGDGSIFSYDPSTSTYTNLLNFNTTGHPGADPYGSLMQASNGKLYGMTQFGGNKGVLFSYDLSNSNYTDLYDFNGIDGANPTGNLIQSSDGKLYGMTQFGGINNYGTSNNAGVLFSYNISTSNYTKLLDCDITTGYYPHGSFMQASNGKLYGMTTEGGSNGVGVLFYYNPSTPNPYNKLRDLNAPDGTSPYFTNFIEIPFTSCKLSISAGPDESTFFGYTGDQQVTHTAIVSGGTAPFTYRWTLGRPLLCNVITSSGDEIFSGGTCTNTVCPTNGSLTGIASCSGSATVTVRLVDTTNVCVTVTDANNCVATDCFLVMAEDVRCFAGNSNNSKVKVCHHTGSGSNPWVQLCIADNAVSAHLAHNSGDYVGSCATNFSYLGDLSIYESSKPGFNIYPNPGNGDFVVSLNLTDADIKGGVIQITNINGQIIKRLNINGQHTLNVSLKESGVYFIRLITRKQVLTKKLTVFN